MVRMLSPRDAEAMADIHAASFEKGWPALDMSVHIGRDLCLGLGLDQGQGQNDPLDSFVILRRSDRDAEILTIATRPSARGQGLAARILNAAHIRLRDAGIEQLFLEVAEDNQSARRLYARLDYVPIGRRPAYYVRAGGRVAAITYSRRLITENRS